MPIVLDKEKGWQIKDPTPEELIVLEEIGKQMIVDGLAGAYTNEKYKRFLQFAPNFRFWGPQ